MINHGNIGCAFVIFFYVLKKEFFINNSDNRPLEVIIENSPATLLTKIANKYFQMLLEVATIINIQLSKNDLELLLPFLDFEK